MGAGNYCIAERSVYDTYIYIRVSFFLCGGARFKGDLDGYLWGSQTGEEIKGGICLLSRQSKFETPCYYSKIPTLYMSRRNEPGTE